jgi:hypothetical protein
MIIPVFLRGGTLRPAKKDTLSGNFLPFEYPLGRYSGEKTIKHKEYP